MLKFYLFAAFMFGVVLVSAATSHGDGTPPPSLPTTAPDEPITDQPAINAAGSETTPHDPFTPYDVGPPSSLWLYDDASVAEKAELDKLRDRTGWQAIHDGYSAGVQLQAKQAAIQAAEHQLNVDNLGSEGVIP